MSNMRVYFEVAAEDALEKLQELEGMGARKALAKGTRKGATKILRDAKSLSPKASGSLKSSIKTKTERGNTKKMKVVVDIMISGGEFNAKFQKPVKKEEGKYGGSTGGAGYYYYPISMEEGFKTANGQVDGKHFMREARDQNDDAFSSAIVDALDAEIARVFGSSGN